MSSKQRRRSKAPAPRRGFEIVRELDDEKAFVELEIGGQLVKVYKMNVGSFQALVKLTEPYIKRAVSALVTQTGLERLGDQQTVREALRKIIADQLSEMVVTVPETVVAACACLMNIRPNDEELTEWLLASVLPFELIEVLPRLDELNDFGALWEDLVGLWEHFNTKYSIASMVQDQVVSGLTSTEEIPEE